MEKKHINVNDAETFGLLFEDFCNMNDKVAVVLTAHGAKLLNEHQAKVNELLSIYKAVKLYPADYKEGDVYEDQMWRIFECFNDYNWHIGADAPFTRILKRKIIHDNSWLIYYNSR